MMMRSAVNFAGLQKNPSVSQPESEEIGEVCISNISPAERRKRLLGGVIGFVIALVILAVLCLPAARIVYGDCRCSCFFLAQPTDIFNGATKPEWDLLRAVRVI